MGIIQTGIKFTGKLFTPAANAYVRPLCKRQIQTLETLGLEFKRPICNVKEIKLNEKMFEFLPWKRNTCIELPQTGKPPMYTQETREATELFVQKGRIERPLPNGFRIAYGPYRFNGDGTLSPVIANGGEILYFDKDSKLLKLMTKQLKKIFSENPGITEEQKAEVLHKFVASCYDRSRYSYLFRLSHDFIPIENTAASGIGVCRHKSFLAKALGDNLGLDVAMVRGWYTTDTELGIVDSHIWNEVKIGNKKFLMDIEQNRFEDLNKFTKFSDLYSYH